MQAAMLENTNDLAKQEGSSLHAKVRMWLIPAAEVPREVPIVLDQNFLLERGLR